MDIPKVLIQTAEEVFAVLEKAGAHPQYVIKTRDVISFKVLGRTCFVSTLRDVFELHVDSLWRGKTTRFHRVSLRIDPTTALAFFNYYEYPDNTLAILFSLASPPSATGLSPDEQWCKETLGPHWRRRLVAASSVLEAAGGVIAQQMSIGHSGIMIRYVEDAIDKILNEGGIGK